MKMQQNYRDEIIKELEDVENIEMLSFLLKFTKRLKRNWLGK